MKASSPFVSVFIPYYNDRAFLRDSIESVLNQSYENFELVLLNHASTDDSRKIARSYKDPRIRHIDVEKNLGAGSGVLMLKFLEIARGKYAKLFCADDIMRPQCIEILVDYLEKNSDWDIVSADVEYVDAEKKSLGTKWSLQRPTFSFENDSNKSLKFLFAGISFVSYPASLIRIESLKQADIDKSFVMMMDMGIWADLLIKGKKLVFVKDVVVDYRIHNLQASSSANAPVVYRRSFFESLKFCEYFYKIRDFETLKFLCPDSPFIDKMDENDVDMFEFVIAHHYLTCGNETYKINGYLHMHDILQDDVLRYKTEKRFGFGIKEFRAIYSTPLPFVAAPKSLGLFKLLYLLFRRLWIIITFKEIKRKWRRKNTYTE